MNRYSPILLLFLFACTSESGPAASADAGLVADAEAPDSGALDAGLPDASAADAMPADAAPGDATPAQLPARYGDPAGAQEISAVAVDHGGNLVVVGDFEDTIDLGGGVLRSLGGGDVFVAKLDAQGGHLWSKAFGDSASFQYAHAVAVDSADDVIVVGGFEGSMVLGAEPLVSAGGADIWVAKYSPEGELLWAQRFGDATDYQSATGVAVDGEDNIAIVGSFDGTVDFGGDPLETAGGTDVFVAKLDPEGNHLFSQSYGDEAAQKGSAIAVDSTGAIVIAGELVGSAEFGANTIRSGGGADPFVAKLGPDGTPEWAERFGDTSRRQTAHAVAVGPSDEIVLSGDFEGSLGLDGMTSTGRTDVFILELQADGTLAWAKHFGDDNSQFSRALAVDGAGNVFSTGQFTGDIDFGGQALSSSAYCMYIAKLDATGAHLASQKTCETGDQSADALAIDGDGSALVGGRFWGRIVLGGTRLSTGDGDYDAFLARLSL